MASFNKVVLIGHLTADPELKQTASGVSVCSFSIAVNRKMSKDNECDFINIQTWRQTAEFVSKYFKKGNPILICGQLQTRSWSDNQGQKRYTTEVVADEVSFVAPANQGDGKPTQTPPNPMSFKNGNMPSAYSGVGNTQFEEVPNDGDLPF